MDVILLMKDLFTNKMHSDSEWIQDNYPYGFTYRMSQGEKNNIMENSDGLDRRQVLKGLHMAIVNR